MQTELGRINPSAARSLVKGVEENLTMHRLGVRERLRKSLFSTTPWSPRSRWSSTRAGGSKKAGRFHSQSRFPRFS